MTMTGAQALLGQILANGTDTIFGLPGGQLDHFFDAMHKAGDKLRLFGTRHEQGAAYMAFGYARSTGKPGVYTVVPGPGVLNTTAALCSAYATNAPVLCLTGQIPSAGIGKGIGYLHELPDQLATMRTLTKWADRAMTPDAAPALVNEAYRQMGGGRPRPVSLEMPMDVMGASADVALLPKAEIDRGPALDDDAILRAAKLLSTARNPLIIAGGGAIAAGEALQELAAMLQAPVVSFRSGRGVISDRSPLSQMFPAGYELWKQADVVIGLGSRMEQQYLYWKVPDHMKVIRIDIDQEEIDRIAPPAVAIHADAADAVPALVAKLSGLLDRRASREDELRDLAARVRGDIEDRVQPQASYLAAIRAALPEDGYFVDEITQVGYTSWYAFPVYEPRHLITCGYQGTLGYGYATALGVKAAHPDKAVVNIAGDGGFLFTANEMATAAQHGIALVTVLFNNNKFQNVQRQQREWFGGRLIASDLKNPDFVKFAESFGIRAERVYDPESLRRAVSAALERNEPALIEVPCGDMASPWPFIIRPPAFETQGEEA
ncbi:thiamine pyrophosphate enzyme domain protein TPP-binding [Rhizorhabdus wittichii RW1]|uniref:Thiamine pyrophosphate enzyme domain protein TPP-binding n=1 Tax=Rhizorhabdus wittichii (strain DSM 6014 / CCUG 31198 / JCM 15750 / NBRC 105917 / EY 4224 / RW1) TaxID=392499 RepID=A0A9J9HAQ5_RHIWR|nr:thiamine pyrophosphate enzyme domain protein TPP-binding [Rhizorhabdus wittichii RW1]